jgi:hypothetical protein
MTVLVGIDLSARGTALVAAPSDWDGQWSRVRSLMVGRALGRQASDAERALRCRYVAAQVVEFCRMVGATQAGFEGYAFNQRSAAHTLAEVGGCVRLALVEAGFGICTVSMQSARKLLLAKVPKQDPKVAVELALRAAGAPMHWGSDELDAACVLNWLMAEHGGFCFAQTQAA